MDPRHLFRSHARLALGALVMLVVALALPQALRWSARALIAWDTGVLVYLAATGRAMLRAEIGDIRRIARAQDEGRFAILGVTTLAIAFSFAAIVAELHVGGGEKAPDGWSLALAAATIVLSWITTQVVMATHYAGEYYGTDGPEGGLDFPGGDAEPDYLDFLYFAFTMGAACQTSDVSVTSRGMRGLVLAHTALAFLFNTLVLALAVNVGASLI
ncbi:DUF1345 domain-containing protein [Antarcticirhabdus aurantiaca]|uniref:DUF1345 domain-containing protein n=1 Tax=Antarcticirhabdus aurantiaca TaxID=2606717 RepID=A0ACD4NQP0_9HYPH|nr:DUF1345 domain-containing protein [Antarcticirhabdus aurantiaca]WAJ28985.1 DUF1345 domain-containing protein [Jeongeuplla avenae]